MARIFSKQIDEFHGSLTYELEHLPEEDSVSEKIVYVYYQPSPERLKQADKNSDDINLYKKKILEFYPSWVNKTSNMVGNEACLTIYPINTTPNDNFMQPKYTHIESITLIGFDYGIPESIEEVKEILELYLPAGFIKDYDYGLGLQNDYKCIINTIEENKEINALIISKYEKTHINRSIDKENGFEYILNYSEYDTIRKGINKITNNFRSEARKDKSIFAYNALLNTINPEQYPERYRSYRKDTVFKFISSSDIHKADLSSADQKEIMSLVSNKTNILAKHYPEAIMKLHNDIELVTLENLILKFEEKLSNKNLTEPHWQKLLSENWFILNLAFGYPIIKVGEQSCVGGRTISGKGEKITDFLVKNNHTNNTALIEIKTPYKELLYTKSTYRGSVYSASRELSGAVNQLLDQKYNFQKQIATLKENSRIHDIETYSVKCVLIIGKTPSDDDEYKSDDKKKSFELFRGNSKDIEIITFDELLENLKQLHIFLSLDDKVEPD